MDILLRICIKILKNHKYFQVFKNFYTHKPVFFALSIYSVLLMVNTVHAKGFAQRISLNMKNARIEAVLFEISKQSNLKLLYNSKFDASKLMDVDVTNVSLEEALEKVLTRNNLQYKIIANTISVNATSEVATSGIGAVQHTVTGTVRDNNGKVLAGVSVRVKGNNVGTVTGPDGQFSIQAAENAVLVFNLIGYDTREIPVNSRSTIVVVLQEVSTAIEEVVATGYQTIDRRRFTGAATKINAADAERAGVPDVSRMLEGQAAGVSVQNVSGTFGAAPKIRVRGATSITGDNKPLWVVDGIVLEDIINISNDQLSTGDANTLLGSSVAGINPDDVESFEILKDAAATSLYGARAMNGVILITTKKGKKGSNIISYSGNYTSYLKPSYSQFDIVNSYDQMSIYAEIARKGAIDYALIKNLQNSGIYGNLSNALSTWNEDGTPLVMNTPEARRAYLERYVYQNTDWFDHLFKNSFMQEHSLSVSNGTDKAQMYYSTSYLKDNGWAMGNGVQRFTGNIRGNYEINDKLSFGLITTGAIRDQKAPGTLGQVSNPVTGEVSRDFDINPFSYAINTSRVIAPYDLDGNYEYVTMNYAPFNILDELNNNYMELKMLDLKVQGEITYKLPKNIKYGFMGAYRYASTGNEHKILDNSNMPNAYRAGTPYGVTGVENSTIADANRFLYTDPANPDGRPTTVLPYGGLYKTNDNVLKSFYLRNTFNWDESFGKHYVTVFANQELRFLDRISKEFTGYGYQFDKGGVPFIDPNAIKMAVESNIPYYSMGVFRDRFAAFAGNTTYSYDGKYQFSGTLRYDGSNQLGNSNVARWLPTWNLSGSWNLDRENFFQNQSFFNTLTIRGTYGLTASMGPATNASLVLRSGSVNRPYLSEQEPVINIQYLQNSDLTWEKQYETNIGIDATFANRRYQVVVDLYNRNGFDLIGPMRISGIGGESIKFANYADMNSKGIEVLFKATVFDTDTWSWKTQLTNAFNVNKITTIKNDPMIWNLVGPTGAAKIDYPYRGLFSIDFQKLHEETGVPSYVNEKGDVSQNVYLQSIMTDYLIYNGPIDPTFNGGLYNAFKYKDFNLSFLITYSAGNSVRLNPIYKNSYTDLDAMSYDFLNRFVAPRENLSPSIATARTESRLEGGQVYNAYNYSDQRIADGGFVRMKQVSIGYRLPSKSVSTIGLKNVSLNLVGNNLFLIYADSKLNGQDPEFYGSGGVALPIPRQFTLSLKANL